MTKTTYTATADNGETFTRTATRAYSHVVVADAATAGRKFVVGWCSRLDLAIKRRDEAIADGLTGIEVLAVDGPDEGPEPRVQYVDEAGDTQVVPVSEYQRIAGKRV